jgi:hypothetical protein
MPAILVGAGIFGASTALGFFGAKKSNKAQERATREFNQRSTAAAALTRQTNIELQGYESSVARQKVSRDSNLLLGQLVVSAAERGVLSSQSTQSSIATLVQNMNNNLSTINMNRYYAEQQIIAATQYPTVQQYTPVNVGLAGLQGALSGVSMGLGVAGGMADLGMINRNRWGL